jgi:hypothetical protein
MVSKVGLFELSFPLPSTGFFLGLLLNPEDAGDMIFRNVGYSRNYWALQPRTSLEHNLHLEKLKTNADGGCVETGAG